MLQDKVALFLNTQVTALSIPHQKPTILGTLMFIKQYRDQAVQGIEHELLVSSWILLRQLPFNSAGAQQFTLCYHTSQHCCHTSARSDSPFTYYLLKKKKKPTKQLEQLTFQSEMEFEIEKLTH